MSTNSPRSLFTNPIVPPLRSLQPSRQKIPDSLHRAPNQELSLAFRSPRPRPLLGEDPLRRRDRRDPLRIGGERDRKSTRLNSSPLGISYAVFCLKKKKRKR